MSLVELKRQFFEISVAAGDAVECSLRLVMFDKVMPDTGLLIMTKDIFPVDQSAAHRGEIGGIAYFVAQGGHTYMMLGLSDPARFAQYQSAFTQSFRKHMGLTPRQFRVRYASVGFRSA